MKLHPRPVFLATILLPLLFPFSAQAALVNGPGRIGPELAIHTEGTNPGRDVVDANGFTGVVSVINNPDWDKKPTNTVPSKKTSPTTLRLWVNISDHKDPTNLMNYVSNLNSPEAAREFPNGITYKEFDNKVPVILNVEMNNLDWWLDDNQYFKSFTQKPEPVQDEELKKAGKQYGELFIMFSQNLTSDHFLAVPAAPDVGNPTYRIEPWTEGFRASGACDYVDAMVADVFAVEDSLYARFGLTALESWKYLETNMCPNKQVIHFQGWGINPNTPPTIREQIDFYQNTPISKEGITATTLIVPHCPPLSVVKPGQQNESGWWYYIDDGSKGRVFNEYGGEIDPDTCNLTTTEAGDHSCRNICSGTPQEPCANTPGNDCSIPFDPQTILEENVNDTTKQEIITYLRDLFNYSTVSKGFSFSVDMEIFDDICATIQPSDQSYDQIISRCNSASGESNSSFTPARTINTITAPASKLGDAALDAIKNMWHGYLQYSGTTNQGPTDPYQYGVQNKTSLPGSFWHNLAAVMKFKTYCYNQGRVLTYQDNEFTKRWGPVRCVNFASYDCPDCTDNFANEKNVFYLTDSGGYGSLFACINQPENNFDTSLCNKLLSRLPKSVQTAILNTPTNLPATFPIIGATDLRVSEDDPNYTNPAVDYQDGIETKNPFMRIGSTITSYILNLKRQSFYEDVNFHKTSYYVYPLVTGQDAFLASKTTYDQFTPPDKKVPLIRDKGLLRQLFDSLFQAAFFLNSNNPFNCTHVPTPGTTDKLDTPEKCLAEAQNGFPNIDQRYWLINFFFNNPDNKNRCTSPSVNQVERTKNNKTIETQTTTVNLKSDVTPLAHSLQAAGSDPEAPDEPGWNLGFDEKLHEFISCEIFPQFLQAADTANQRLKNSLLPSDFLQTISYENDNEVSYSTNDLGNSSGSIKAQQDTCLGDETSIQNWVKCRALNIGSCQPSPCCSYFTSNPGHSFPAWVETSCYDPIPVTEINFKAESEQFSQISPIVTDKDGPVQVEKTNNTIRGYKTIIGGEAVKAIHRLGWGAFMPPQCASDKIGIWSADENPDGVGREKLYWDHLDDRCGLKDQSDIDKGDCTFSGGYPIVSQNFRQLICTAHQDQNAPLELMVVTLAGENCRFTSGERNVCNQTDSFFSSQNYLDQGVSYNGFFPGCPGSTDDYSGMMQLWDLSTNPDINTWNTISSNTGYTQACSIHDYTQNVGYVLNHNYHTNTNSSVSQAKSAMVTWVLGDERVTKVAATGQSPTCQQAYDFANSAVDGYSHEVLYQGDPVPDWWLYAVANYCCATDIVYGQGSDAPYCNTGDTWMFDLSPISKQSL